jgi:hypothetical protein
MEFTFLKPPIPSGVLRHIYSLAALKQYDNCLGYFHLKEADGSTYSAYTTISITSLTRSA